MSLLARARLERRRMFLAQVAALTCARTGATDIVKPAANLAPWTMPDEAAPHLRTWMSFGATPSVWGRAQLADVQHALARIARTIAEFEPVHVLVRPEDRDVARRLLGPSVTRVECALDDIWMRDSGPTFVVGADGGKAAIDSNFNGWGNKQVHRNDARVAAFVARTAAVERVVAPCIFEGGGIEVDGEGTAIVTESCVLNANRNPGMGKRAFERALNTLFGVRTTIWLPGIRGRDITDGHTDFYARFARPGVVVAALDPDIASYDYEITRLHLKRLQAATDSKGRRLRVIALEGPRSIRARGSRDDFAAGYINYYVCNGGVVIPEFGDAQADTRARQVIGELFPGREVVALNIDAIAAGGGGIHCTTQQEPRS